MHDIKISSLYFFNLNQYIHQQKFTALFVLDELSKLQEMATQDFLTKFDLSIFNFYIKKLIEAQISSELFFDIAQYFDIKHYGIIGYISTHANNFFDAAYYLEKFSTFIIDAKDLEQLQFQSLSHSSAITWPKWNAESLWLNEINLATIFRVIKQLSQPYADFKFEKIHISHSPLMPIKSYQAYYQCEVVFNCTFNGLYVSNALLEKTLPSRDEVLLGILLNQAQATLFSLMKQSTPPSLEDKLTLLIQQYLELGELIPDIEILANSFHMSKRTFQRKLQQHNIIYRQFLEKIKMQYCMKLLENREMHLSEIAQKLGYSDQSSLGRAFKKNFGQSMKNFHQQ